MYKLKIQKPFISSRDAWQDADLGEDKPAMNYQINNLNELKDRQTDYSQVIKLPKTKNNLDIFNRLDVFENNNLTPYKLLNCRLYQDDYELAGVGSKLQVLSISEYIECVILSGNIGIFEELKELDIEDVDLGSYIVGDNTSFPAWVKEASCLTEATTGLGGEWIPVGPPQPLELFINLDTIMRKVFNHKGYSLLHNLTTEEQDKHFISLASKKGSSDSLLAFNSSGNASRVGMTGLIPVGGTYTIPITSIPNNGSGTLSTSGSMFKFISNIKGKIKIKFIGQGGSEAHAGMPNFNQFQFALLVRVNNVQTQRMPLSNVAKNTSFPETQREIILDVEVGDVVHFYYALQFYQGYSGYSADINVNTSAVFTLTEIEAETIPNGGTLFLNKNIGFENYFDLFKTYIQTYGMTVAVGGRFKTVSALTFKELYDSRPKAIDWTNKFVKEGLKTSYAFEEYAQQNTIAFESDKEIEDKGIFNIADETLEKEKELFTMKWQAGYDSDKTGYNVAFIPSYKKDSNDIPTYIGAKPHLVLLTYLSGFSVYKANHITAQTLLDNYYMDLTSKILNNTKRIEATFNLSSQDIQNHNPFISIYLKQFGAYFYIEKINNFIAGELTKVNLIKL